MGSKYGLLKVVKKFFIKCQWIICGNVPRCQNCHELSYGFPKTSYVTTYGLAPYFHSLLLQKISSSPHQVVSFDESLNNSIQKGQMDLLIHYWDNDADRVYTCYMGSEFMGRKN